MISKFVCISLVCAFMSALLDGLGFRSKRLFVTLSTVILMIGVLDYLSEIVDPIMSLARDVGLSELADKSLRAVGLGYVFGFSSDICASLGETTLATLVNTVGKLEIFMLALPYFVKTVELGMELLS